MFNVYKGKDSPKSNTIFCTSHTAGSRGRGRPENPRLNMYKNNLHAAAARTARPVPSPQGPGARGEPARGSRAGGGGGSSPEGLRGGLDAARGRARAQQLVHHGVRVAQPAGQLPGAAELLQEAQAVRAEVPLLVDVGHGGHQGAQDELGVVLGGAGRADRWSAPRGPVCGAPPAPRPGPPPPHLEEVDLHTAVAEVQHDGAAGAEPGAQVGQPGQLVAFPGRDVGPRLQQVLAHVVPEVLEEGDLGGEGRSPGLAGGRARARGPPAAQAPWRPAPTFFIRELGCEFTVR